MFTATQLPSSLTTIATKIDRSVTQNTSVKLEKIKSRVRKEYPVSKPDLPVVVQKNTNLSSEEKTFIKHRMKKIEHTLKTYLGINQPLRMAICCGGQDAPAMLCTLGLLQAAQDSKILDSTLYLVANSGATWMVAPWSYLFLQNKLSHQKGQSFIDLENHLQTTLTHLETTAQKQSMPPMIPAFLTHHLAPQLLTRFGYNQPLSILDIYAGYLANFTLRFAQEGRFHTTWSSIALNAMKGKIPLPICTCLYKENNQKYHCLENSPFQAGAPALGYIPIQYLGSEFKNGILQSDNMCPEYPISYFLSIYSSKQAGIARQNYHQLIERFAYNPHITVTGNHIELPVKTWIKTICSTPLPAQTVSAFVHNFTYQQTNSPIKTQKYLELLDCAAQKSISIDPLISRPERKIDVLFLCDGSSDEKALLNTIQHVLPLKNQTNQIMRSETMIIINDPHNKNYDATQPTCFYFPVTKYISKSPNSFTYNPHIPPMMKENFESNLETIIETLQLVGQAKYPEASKK
ncbi:hypothetical protein KBD08_01640 [Candidatus Babeliales bacterium]|nr:hypothetical protein [Candidatus Babeliales bacterium]